MIREWNSLSSGELGASASLCELIFVSLSVNQHRILSFERMADRGIESLSMLFLVLVLSSVALIPTCSIISFGIAAIGLGALTLATVVLIQLGYLRHIDLAHRRKSGRVAWFSRSAPDVVFVGGSLLTLENGTGLYLISIGILLSFQAAGVNAWVLLIEINR